MSNRWPLAVVLTGCLFSPLVAAAQQPIEAECHAGEPMGAAFVSLPLKRGEPLPTIREANGRALYVAAVHKRRGLIRNRGEFGQYWFLFHGDSPLELSWNDQAGTSFLLVPGAGRERAARQVTADWWEAFGREAQRRIDDDAPDVADQYLLAMLARRMRLPLEVKRRQRRDENRQLATIELLSGTQRLRGRVLRESMLLPGPRPLPATAPPAPPIWAEPADQPVAEDVVIERLAKHVPPECFYVRFGKFSNFMWMTHLIREQGGDLSGMISSRAVHRDLNDRFERQFAIRYSAIADLLGDHVVSDVALIGTDMYLEDGASMGVLLEVKNSLLLDTALGRERSSAVSREAKGRVRREQVKIGKHEVDLIATADNSVRSYLASSGDVRLVTNSRRLAERFLAVEDGQASLGASNEFQHARTLMPVDRDDTLFAYFSSGFFHNLVSPQYQIELRRRLRVVCDFQLIELAQLAARREGLPDDEASLVAAGLLPSDWTSRVDGGRLLPTDDGWTDSLRGARGVLRPIADTKLSQVTQHERQQYAELAAYYQQQWRTMDPLMVAVKRYSVDGQPRRERLVIDAHVSPFIDRKYGPLLTLLGPSTTDRVAAPEDAVIVAQASLKGGLWRPEVPAHQVFLGILDRRPEIDDLRPDGLLDTLRTIQAVPGYLGAWPRPGFLDFLPFAPQNQEDADGFSRLPFRLWRFRRGEYSALAFSRPLLESAAPSLAVEQAEAPAQVWARVGDLTETKLAPWIRDLNYRRAVTVTGNNARCLTTLSTQLGAGAEAPAVAGRLVDGQLRCPLGGEYRREGATWRPTVDGGTTLGETPADYQSPLLSWFRGGALMLNGAGSGRLTLHGEIDLQRAERESLIKLPLLDGLPKLFGGAAKQPQAEQPETKQPETKQPETKQPETKKLEAKPRVGVPF